MASGNKNGLKDPETVEIGESDEWLVDRVSTEQEDHLALDV